MDDSGQASIVLSTTEVHNIIMICSISRESIDIGGFSRYFLT